MTDPDKAVPLLERSLEHYQQLVELAGSHYLYANSMQTDHRKIPIGGDNGTNKTWRELLPHYRKELANLEKHIGLLRAGSAGQIEKKAADWLFVSGTRVHQ